MSNFSKDVKEEVCKYARMMEAAGFGNSYEGNISIKHGDFIYITPSRQRKATLVADKIAVTDMDGNQVDGPLRPSSELLMHIACYKHRDNINAVVHSHSLYLTGFAMCHKEIEVNYIHEFLAFFKKIPCAAYGRPSTDEIWKDLVKHIQNYDCVLLANHGSVVVGDTLDKAFSMLESAEGIAKIIVTANQIGTPVDLPKEEIEFWRNFRVDDNKGV